MKSQIAYFAVAFIVGSLPLHAQQFTKVVDSPISTTPGDSRSVNWIDVNKDGFIDCFISNGPQAGQNNMLYINDQTGQFVAVTDDPIVKDKAPSDGATFADVDNDGDMDGFVVNWYNKNNLAYLNQGDGTFVQVTKGQWVNHAGYSETAAFGDYDNDGLVDLYVTNSAGNKRNFLYHNEGDTTMANVTLGPHVTEATTSRNVSWVDMDSDGDVDLFVTNESNERNQVYRNDGDGVFTKLEDVALANDAFSTMSSCWGDTDNDGDLDVFLANEGSKNQYFRNDGGFVFTPILTTDISEAIANSFSCAMADIDNDADLDLFVTNAFKPNIRLRNLMYINDGTGHFTQETTEAVTKDLGWSYGCAFGDYDNDGFMDLAVATTRFGNTDEADYLYHNTPNGNHYLMLDLEGTMSNRSAIGTVVRMKANIDGQDIWQMREVTAQSGYCGQNDMRVHFGLGDATMVDSIIIEWPSGVKEYLSHITANQIYRKQEGQISSTRKLRKNIGLRLYPNPVSEAFSLMAEAGTPHDDVSVEISNDTGMVVHRMAIDVIDEQWEMKVPLDQLDLAAGIYFIRIYNQEIEETLKFIYSP